MSSYSLRLSVNQSISGFSTWEDIMTSFDPCTWRHLVGKRPGCVCYYCLVMGWSYPCFSLVRITLLSLIYQKTCNRLSSTNFQGWHNMNDAHFLEMWRLDPTYLLLNCASCIMWWDFDSEFVMVMVKR